MTETRKVDDWFGRMPENLWLKADETGQKEARFIKGILHLPKGQAVLDSPCGTGRIAFHLARAGLDVTGIDRMASFLARARRRFRKEGLKGRFVLGDMRKLDFDGDFHGVFNFAGSFDYFSDKENLDVLRCLARALRPGGRVVIDQPNREYVLRHFQPVQRHGRHTLHCKWNPTTQRTENIWSITQRGRKRSCRWGMRFYTPAQFRDLFARAGLKVEAMYGSLDGSEYSRGSRRIYVVGRKE